MRLAAPIAAVAAIAMADARAASPELAGFRKAVAPFFENCRSAYRDRYSSRDQQTYLGYRVVIQRVDAGRK